VIILIVLLAGAGVGVGLSLKQTYKAEARANVGRVDVPAITLQGVLFGSQLLASNYARLIAADPVVLPTAQKTGLSPDTVRSRLSASPLPGSTLIRIEANGPNKAASIALSNAGMNALVAYVAKLNTQQSDTDLLNEFRRQQSELDNRTLKVRKLSRHHASRAAIERARLDQFTTQLRLRRLTSQITSSGLPGNGLLVAVAPAATASSDRTTKIEELGLIGLAAGIFLGLGIAVLLSNAELLRRRREG